MVPATPPAARRRCAAPAHQRASRPAKRRLAGGATLAELRTLATPHAVGSACDAACATQAGGGEIAEQHASLTDPSDAGAHEAGDGDDWRDWFTVTNDEAWEL